MTTKEARERLIQMEQDNVRLRAEVAELEHAVRVQQVCLDAFDARHKVISAKLREHEWRAQGLDLEMVAHAFAARSFAPEVYDDVE